VIINRTKLFYSTSSFFLSTYSTYFFLDVHAFNCWLIVF